MNQWIPMTDDDWDWVNGKQPQPKQSYKQGEFRLSLNTCMMKAKITQNLISFVAVRRGEWILKVSVFKNKQIMVIAQNCYAMEVCIIRYFLDQNGAADFIEQLVIED